MKILIACGGTAGHLFSGLALAEKLKQRDSQTEIILVTSNHPRERKFLAAGGPVLKKVILETICAAALPYKFSVKFIPFIIGLLAASFKSLLIILRYRPQVAVGFGGYAAAAPIALARLSGVPALIHEQNLVPGRANRLLARLVNKIAISFDQTHAFLPAGSVQDKIVTTGMPLRERILTALEDKAKREKTKIAVAVIGGSQGSKNINQLVLDCLGLMDQALLSRLQLIHISGKADLENVKTRYRNLTVQVEVFDFVEDMAGIYKKTDILISRSGAGTIFEAAAFGLACLLIPHAYGTAHQKENALLLQRKEAALVLDEGAASAGELKKILESLIKDGERRSSLSGKIRHFFIPEAADNLREMVIELAGRH